MRVENLKLCYWEYVEALVYEVDAASAREMWKVQTECDGLEAPRKDRLRPCCLCWSKRWCPLSLHNLYVQIVIEALIWCANAGRGKVSLFHLEVG